MGVALGIILAGVIATTGRVLIIGTLINSFSNALEQNLKINVPTTNIYNGNGKFYTSQQQRQPNPLNATIQPAQPQVTKAIEQIRQGTLSNTRETQIKKISQKAEIQARNETQSFDAQYKKPDECYNIENHATRVKCSNDYMRARAAFEKEHKTN